MERFVGTFSFFDFLFVHLLSEFQVHSDEKCSMWPKFELNKTSQRTCIDTGLSVAGRTIQ